MAVAHHHTSAVDNDHRILIGIIADAETTVGFLLAGVGETKDHKRENRNYLIVNEFTGHYELETFFINLYNRKNVGVILIGADIITKLSATIARIKKTIPIILPIPTRNTLTKTAATPKKKILKQY